MGWLWDFSYNVYLTAAGADLVLHDGQGRADAYFWQGDGTWMRPELAQRLRRNPDGSWTLEFADRAEWSFHPLDGSLVAGRLALLADRNGNRLAFAYDPAGRLSAITDSLDRTVTVQYGAEGFIESLSDFSGRTVRYQYYQNGDADGMAGDLKAAISPAVTGLANGNNFPAGKTNRYTYAVGFADERRNHNLLTVTDPKGQVWLRNTYATNGDPADLLFDRCLRQVHGEPGDIMDVTYWPEMPTPANAFAAVRALVNDREGNVSERVFDLRNRLLIHRVFTGRANPDAPTTDTVNRPVNPLRATDPLSFETRFEWTENSKLARIVHPSGERSERVYESDLIPGADWRARGNLRLKRRVPDGRSPQQAPLIETFYYDAPLGSCCGVNFVTRSFDANGHRTLHVYDDHGNRVRTVQPILGAVEEWEYNGFGQRTAHIYPDNGNGHRQRDEFVYHQAGPQKGYLAAKIADARGVASRLEFQYDARGNRIRTTDANGRVSTALFNALDQLVQETTREVTDGSGVHYQRESFYDANDNLVRKEHLNLDADGNLLANSQLSIRFEYDILNREIREIREVDSARNIVTESVYDANGQVILKRSGEATGGDLDPATTGAQPFNVLAFSFDERGLEFRRTEAAGSAHARTLQADYDLNGSLVRESDNLERGARITQFEYDGLRRLRRRTDAMGNVASYAHDANGNLTWERIDGELTDNPGGTNNVRLWERQMVYDARNHLVQERSAHFDPVTQQPLGDGWATTTIEYTPRGGVSRVTDDNGHSLLKRYDSLNRPSLIRDAKGNTVAREYDVHGNPIAVVETAQSDVGRPARTFTWRHEYDNLSRRIATIDPLGHRTEMAFDSLDNLTSITDPRGNVVQSEFDGFHRLVRQRRLLTADGTGGTPVQEVIVTTQVWDDNSRVIARTDGNGNTTRYAYDERNRLIVCRLPDGTLWQVGRGAVWADNTPAPNLSAFQSGYGNENSPVLITEASGTIIHAEYDLLDRLTERQLVPGPGVAPDATFERFQYDGLAHLVRAVDDDALVQRTYDSLGNLTAETLNGQTATGRFDAAGNRRQCVWPSGLTVDFGWDELNRLQTIEAASRVLARYGYFGRRQVESRLLPGSQPTQVVRSEYDYDGNQRLRRLTHLRDPSGVPEVLLDLAVDYDANANPIHQTQTGWGSGERTMTYDSANRLWRTAEQAATQIPQVTEYTLDHAGNRTAVQVGSNAALYQVNVPLNQYEQTPWASQTHDLNGNLVEQTNVSAQRQLEYDAVNRLVRVTRPDSISRCFYDPLGRRIGKRVTDSAGQNVAVTRYSYLGPRLLERQEDVAGQSTLTRYLPGAGSDEILGMQRGGQSYFFHQDNLGNIVGVTDAAGQVVESYRYDAYGAVKIFDATGQPVTASTIGNVHGFQGRPFDAETGFYQFGHRYLDPQAGRFLTRDPLGTWGDPLNLGNAYTYAGNNPHRYTDPTGLGTIRTSIVPGKDVTLTIEFFHCSNSQMDKMEDDPDYLSTTFASLEDAHDDVHAVVNGGTPVEPATLSEMRRWFSGKGSSGTLDSGDKDKIHDVLWDVEDHMRKNHIKFECESAGNNKCDGNNAYVLPGSNHIHLCPSFWNLLPDGCSAVIFHEMTHAYAGADDVGYLTGGPGADPPKYEDKNGNSITPSKKQLLRNADTYEQFLLYTWLP